MSRKPESKWRHIYFLQRAAMIHWCVTKLIYFFSWTEYQYWNNISLYYETTKYATSANLWNHWLIFITQAPLFLQLPDVSHEKLLYNTYHYYSVKVINVTLRTNFARYKEDIATACNIIWAQNSPFLETPIKRKTSHQNPKRLTSSALFNNIIIYLLMLVVKFTVQETHMTKLLHYMLSSYCWFSVSCH